MAVELKKNGVLCPTAGKQTNKNIKLSKKKKKRLTKETSQPHRFGKK